MKTNNKIIFYYIVIIGVLATFSHVSSHILMWDLFERQSLSPWQAQTSGTASVDLISENPQTEFSHQSHGEKSLRINDIDNSAYANARCNFPPLPGSEHEFMVELYFYINNPNIGFSDLAIYNATRGMRPANISIFLQTPFDSIGRRFWRLRIEDNAGAHFISYPETIKFWYKFQIHQLESGVVNLWINGESAGSFTSASSTLAPYIISIGTYSGSQNGEAFWDDFFITTPPRNVQHPRIYFNSSLIPELRNRRTNDNTTPIGVSYKTLWDRRRSWVTTWKSSPIPDQHSGYQLPYPYSQPPTLANWNAIGGRWQRRLELTAFVAKIDEDHSPNLFDTLRLCLKEITRWQQWVNPAETIRFPPPSLLPFEYLNHSTAFITEGASIVYDLIYERLTSYEKMSMQNSILALGVGQIYLGLQKGLSTGTGWYWGNWGCLYSSAMGIACLALDDTITLPYYLNFISNEFIPALLSPTGPSPYFDPLGTNDEGLAYGTFSCQSLVRLAEAKKNVCGDLSLFEYPYIQEYISGFVHLLVSGWDDMVQFGDIETWFGLKVIMGDVFYILTNQYQSRLGQWLLSKMVPYDTVQADDLFYGWPISYLPQFINLKADLQMTHPKDILGLTRYFTHIGWISARSNWLDSALVIAFKCGPVYSGHGNHQDNNNFIIGTKNQWLIADRGYKLHDVSYYHNVLTVDGQPQNWSRLSRITAFDICSVDTQFIFFDGDASPSYSYILNNHPLLKKWNRNGVLIRGPIPCFVLYDDIKSDIPRNLDWRLRPCSASPYYGGDSIFIQGGYNNNLLVKFLLPLNPKIEFDRSEYEIDPDSVPCPYFIPPDTGCYRNANVYNVGPNLNDTAVTEAKYLTVFYPCATVAGRPTIARIDGTTMVGAQIKNSVVMFSKIDTTVDEVGFTLPNVYADTISTLLVHLVPLTQYTIIVKDTSDNIISIDTRTSSQQGSLTFKILTDGPRRVLVSSKITLAGKNATYPNQSRHLNRTVNTRDCYLVYQGENSVFWQERSEVIGEPIPIDRGQYPSIAVTSRGHSWVCYTTSQSQQLNCAIHRSQYPEDWNRIRLFRTESIFAPSLVLATPIFGTPENMGYVVYTTKERDASYIRFSAFDTLRGEPYYTTIIDEGNVSAPSIAVTPGDYIHIVWRKDDRIYYITTLEKIMPEMIRQGHRPVWSDIVPISTQAPQTEPASNPFVEAQGEKVFVVWRGPNEEGNPEFGEIWQRDGKIRPGQMPDWREPRNVSQTPPQESNYPTMSTGTAVVWQESLPNPPRYQIYGEIQGQARNLSNNQYNSRYPHTNLGPAPLNSPFRWRLYTIWTEQDTILNIYRIGAGHYDFGRLWLEPIIAVDGGKIIPSKYLIERLGYIDFGDYSVDYAFELIYKLCYLHPEKYYLLEAISYNNATTKEKFVFEDNATKTIQIEPSDPETLRIILRPNHYEDAECLLKIRKLIGEYAVLSKLYLYEFEIFEGSGSGPQSLWGYDGYDFIPTTTLLHIAVPNPFKNRLLIQYQLAKTSKVLLSIYDAQGRLIRTLLNETNEPGIYKQIWDVRDNRGRKVPTGVYFYRLETDDYQSVNKVVLMR